MTPALDSGIVRAAVTRFCELKKDVSFVEGDDNGHARWVLATPDGEVPLRLVDGRVACESEPVKTKILEIIMDMRESEPVESPKTAIKPARHTSAPPATRNAANGQIMKPTAELTIEDIKSYICQDATDQEAYVFLQLCQARRLNPFLKEAYLIKYGGKASMVVGKDAFTRRAEEHPAFDGFQAGVIVEVPGGEVDYNREGTFLRKGEVLLGGWAVVHRKDRAHPFKAAVSLEEYGGKKGGVWSEKPATMIRKVALVQALREAFPSEFSGMYDSAEMGMEAEP